MKRSCPSNRGADGRGYADGSEWHRAADTENREKCKMARQMKHMTYNNLMAVIRKIQTKGYDFDTAERLARSVFTEYAARPEGLSIEQRIERILDYEEWVRQ